MRISPHAVRRKHRSEDVPNKVLAVVSLKQHLRIEI